MRFEAGDGVNFDLTKLATADVVQALAERPHAWLEVTELLDARGDSDHAGTAAALRHLWTLGRATPRLRKA